ncbi:MAG TPA: TetR/AcrR family transcriptional regulator [Actinospica sp.]|jgi:AcrR family transcriptional regulator|nr:TetR/AcrR family transcriptional regulator [Actinospica sp.]
MVATKKDAVNDAANTAGPANTASSAKPSARERLLAAADELFYREGVHTVGIDRVIEHAGVAKASLYNTFGSKEALIRAYLDKRHTSVLDRIAVHLERYDSPREKLLGIFEVQSAMFSAPRYRGCAFIAATAESESGGQAEAASDAFRAELRALMADLAAQAGIADAQGFARKLHLLYDGGSVSARMDRDPSIAIVAREAAATLIDAALAASAAAA